MKKTLLIIFVVTAFVLFGGVIAIVQNAPLVESKSDASPVAVAASPAAKTAQQTKVKPKAWFEGGTLQDANALAWQTADYENKLATAGDFVAALYNKKSFTPETMKKINNMDDIKILSRLLVKQLDDAFMPDPNPETNKMMFTNQKVSDTAVLVMLAAKWL